MNIQPDLFPPPPRDTSRVVSPEDQDRLRNHLHQVGWQTRRELSKALSWDERKIRAVAEAFGADIVRCQLGYKLTADCTRDDMVSVQQAVDAAESQARRMEKYSIALRRHLHAIVG